MKNIIVLVTGVGAPGAPGIIKSLRLVSERKIKIIGTDMDKNAVGFAMVDKGYIVPSAESDDFFGEIKNIVKKEMVNVVLLLNTKELAKFSVRKEELEKIGAKVSVSDVAGVEIANDKFLLMEKCRQIGVPVPNYKLANSYDEFRKAVYGFGYPQKKVCFKPPVSNGMRGFRVLSDKFDRFRQLIEEKPTNIDVSFEEIEAILKNASSFPKLLVMEYLPGGEYSVDVLVDEGKFIVAVPRTRDKIKMGISFVGTAVLDEQIIEYSKKIAESLKLNGNVGFQFKKDENGVPRLIESNPRLQGTIVLCTAAGANLAYGAVKIAIGEKFEKPNIKWGTKMVRYWDEVYFDGEGNNFNL